MPSAGKHAAGVYARENMQQVSSAGKNATSTKVIGLKQQNVGSDWLEHYIKNFKPIKKKGKLDT